MPRSKALKLNTLLAKSTISKKQSAMKPQLVVLHL